MNELPKENLEQPTTKGNNTLLLTLFDFSVDPPKRMALDLVYDPQNFPASCPDGLKVSITAGDNIVSGTVSLPVAMLYAAMSQLMEAHHAEKMKGLVGFDKPSIIIPS